MRNNIEKPIRLLVDLESLYKRGFLGGMDPEGSTVEFEGKQVHVNGVAHGVFNTIEYIETTLKALDAAPYQLVLVTGGMNSNAFRKAIDDQYKASRSKRHPMVNDRMNEVKQEVIRQLRAVGATHCYLDNWEADDIIAYLAKELDGVRIVVSTDGDLAQLVGGDVMLYNPGTGAINVNPFGNFPFPAIPLYKALVGDSSDNIKGAAGFGPKAFEDLYAREGDKGLHILARLVDNHLNGKRPNLDDLQDEAAEFKPFQKVIDSASSVTTSWRLAQLYPQNINTCRKPLVWEPGMVQEADHRTVPSLRKWSAKRYIVDNRNFEHMLEFMRGGFEDSLFVALDIETSAPEASDNWVNGFDEKGNFVDAFGATLSGMGITFGDNQQHTVYLTVDHVTEHNLSLDQVKAVIEAIPCRIAVHNAAFELPVLFNVFRDCPLHNDYRGFLPNIEDTMMMSSYVDENLPMGLKANSKHWLGYEQVSYSEVTQGRKMNQLTPEEVLSYGTDDTICTAALYNFFRLVLELESTFEIYRELEIDTAYLLAMGFVQGVNVDEARLHELEKVDEATHAENWKVVEAYLIENSWPGTQLPQYDATRASVKAAFEIVTGKKFDTLVKKVDKLAGYCIENGAEELGRRILKAGGTESNFSMVDYYVEKFFKASPDFNPDSSNQKQKLLYEVMGLPIRLRNIPTEKMRERQGRLPRQLRDELRKPMTLTETKELLVAWDHSEERAEELLGTLGTPSADDDAIGMALAMDIAEGDHRAEVLNALLKVSECNTRRKLYYEPYPKLVHWKDGKLHPQFRQSSTVTRRFSGASPNLQQMSKSGGIRSVILPHSEDALLVSCDCSGQELRLAAWLSQDENMLSCYIGDHLKDIHSITGAKIAAKRWGRPDLTYEEFREQYKAEDKGELPTHDAIEARTDAKPVNFGRQYDAQAFTLSVQLRVPEEVGAEYLEAYDQAFPGVAEWKQQVVEDSQHCGYATSLMGARRHLWNLLNHPNRAIASKAGRQGPNYAIQGSGCEQIKKVMSRIWNSDIFERLGVVWYFSVHDEVVLSIPKETLYEAVAEIHGMMTQPFATMQIPVVSSIDIGTSFGDMVGLGEALTREGFDKAMHILGESPKAQEVCALA